MKKKNGALESSKSITQSEPPDDEKKLIHKIRIRNKVLQEMIEKLQEVPEENLNQKINK